MSDELRCPYCRGPLEADDGAFCLVCRTPHHPMCLAAHGGCTVFGCQGQAALIGGARRHVDELAEELDFSVIPFRVLDGLPEREPRFLRVEGVEDEAVAAARPSLAIELPRSRARRGSQMRGALVIESPKALHFGRLLLRLTTEVETTLSRGESGRARRRQTRVIEREVVVAGRGRAAGSRLVDGVLRLIGRPGERLVAMPPGRRSYLFSLRIDLAFSASVEHRRAGEEDRVRSELRAVLEVPLGRRLEARTELVID